MSQASGTMGGMVNFILARTGDWTAPNVIQTLVAIGSLGAAFAAGWAVRASNRVAEATETQAVKTAESVDLARLELRQGEQELELSRTSLQASYRPVIVSVPHSKELSPAGSGRTHDPGHISFTYWQDSNQQGPNYEHVHIGIPVRNVGSGLAFLEAAWFQVQGQEVLAKSADILIAANEGMRLSVELISTHAYFSLYHAGHAGMASIQLRVIYSDLSRKQLWENRFMAEYQQDEGYSVTSLIIDELPPKP